MDRWSQLSLKDKSDLMSLYIKNGISSLEEIRKHYNSFNTGDHLYQDGGPVSKKIPNFVQRFNEGNKRDIPFQGGHATHLLSYAERDGKYYVYPQVQPTDYNNSNSPLQYYGRDWRVAFDRAYDNNDYLEFDTEEAARNYSENYKKVPSTGAVLNGRNRGNYNILDYMRGYATGGSIEDDDLKSLLDKKKIYNRLPADALEYKQTIPLVSQTVDALKKYYRNPDNYVDNKINAAKKAIIEIEGNENLKDFEKEYLKFKQKHLIALEDAKDVYLGMPQRTGTITTATEEPTIRTSKNPLYKSSFMKEPYMIENYWIPAINNLKLHNIEGVGYNQDYPGDISKIGNSGKNAVSLLPLLGNATVGYGVDPEKGEYISYYDDWDINMSGTPNTKDTVGKYFGGKPFELYDRLYLDEYYKINTKPDKGVYYGGYLPEIIIFDNN